MRRLISSLIFVLASTSAFADLNLVCEVDAPVKEVRLRVASALNGIKEIIVPGYAPFIITRIDFERFTGRQPDMRAVLDFHNNTFILGRKIYTITSCHREVLPEPAVEQDHSEIVIYSNSNP